MGATHNPDLTPDVTHLVVGSINTPKYKYVAKARPDVKVVLPGFVKAVRRSWMAGEDTDVQAMERTWRVPTLFKLTICLTGFGDREFFKFKHPPKKANSSGLPILLRLVPLKIWSIRLKLTVCVV